MATKMDKDLFKRMRSFGVRKSRAKEVAGAVRNSPKAAPKAARRAVADLSGAVVEIQDRLNHGPQKRKAAAKKAARTRKQKASAAARAPRRRLERAPEPDTKGSHSFSLAGRMAPTTAGNGVPNASAGLGVELIPGGREEVARRGPVGSVHDAKLLVPAEASGPLVTSVLLKRVACEYLRFLCRISLGLLRVRFGAGHQAIALLLPRAALLRFRAPRYSEGSDWAEVGWDIERGLLVAREDVDGAPSGFVSSGWRAMAGRPEGLAFSCAWRWRATTHGSAPEAGSPRQGPGCMDRHRPESTVSYFAGSCVRSQGSSCRRPAQRRRRSRRKGARERDSPRPRQRRHGVRRWPARLSPLPIQTGRCAAWSAIDRERGSWPTVGSSCMKGDVLDSEALRGAGRDVGVGYYLIHSMGRGAAGDFEERERQGARSFAEMAKREGVGRVIYLGGLGDRPQSKHLRSRRRTAQILSESLDRR